MSNLKALKGRIASVKSTRKITKAMKMVAASKLRNARIQAERSRIYSGKLNEILFDVIGNLKVENLSEKTLNILQGNDNVKTDLFVVLSSDRGLCGGFNNHIAKHVKKLAKKSKQEGRDFKIFSIGKKIYDLLQHDLKDHFVAHINSVASKNIDVRDASKITKKIVSMFEAEEFGRCFVVYNYFKSPILQEARIHPLIPLIADESFLNDNNENEVEKSEEISDNSKGNYVANNSHDLDEGELAVDFEPSQEAVIDVLLPKNIAVQIYQILLENYASEQGARMTAMDNAVKNCEELLAKLTLQFNRTRQANITRELIEIISGAESL